jgi:hypothetical protein
MRLNSYRNLKLKLSGQSGSAILAVLTFGTAGALLALGFLHGWLDVEPAIETLLELYYAAIA